MFFFLTEPVCKLRQISRYSQMWLVHIWILECSDIYIMQDFCFFTIWYFDSAFIEKYPGFHCNLASHFLRTFSVFSGWSSVVLECFNMGTESCSFIPDASSFVVASEMQIFIICMQLSLFTLTFFTVPLIRTAQAASLVAVNACTISLLASRFSLQYYAVFKSC